MRSNIAIWYIIAVFFLVMAGIYGVWTTLEYGGEGKSWMQSIEWIGTIAIAFSAIMSLMIGFYIARVSKAVGGTLPEDRLDADIDDGDPEIGEFSPWSWWPLVLASSASIFVIGLAVGTFLLPIGVAIFAIAIVGWVYEYYRGYFAR